MFGVMHGVVPVSRARARLTEGRPVSAQNTRASGRIEARRASARSTVGSSPRSLDEDLQNRTESEKATLGVASPGNFAKLPIATARGRHPESCHVRRIEPTPSASLAVCGATRKSQEEEKPTTT